MFLSTPTSATYPPSPNSARIDTPSISPCPSPTPTLLPTSTHSLPRFDLERGTTCRPSSLPTQSTPNTSHDPSTTKYAAARKYAILFLRTVGSACFCTAAAFPFSFLLALVGGHMYTTNPAYSIASWYALVLPVILGCSIIGSGLAIAGTGLNLLCGNSQSRFSSREGPPMELVVYFIVVSSIVAFPVGLAALPKYIPRPEGLTPLDAAYASCVGVAGIAFLIGSPLAVFAALLSLGWQG